jgi:hypothetical protein
MALALRLVYDGFLHTVDYFVLALQTQADGSSSTHCNSYRAAAARLSVAHSEYCTYAVHARGDIQPCGHIVTSS